MKVFTSVMKVVAALAAVVGAVYVVAAYGDKIVAWAKELCHKYGHHGTQFYMTEDTPKTAEEAEEAAPVAEPADPDQAVESDFED